MPIKGTYYNATLGAAPTTSGQIGYILVSPSSGWTQGTLSNGEAIFATFTIPVSGTWLISFGIVIGSTAVTTGQLRLTNVAFPNIGLTNVNNQALFGASFINSNSLTFQGSLVVNNISGVVTVYTAFSGGNGLTCSYSTSFIIAVRIA